MGSTAALIGNENYEQKFGFHDDEAALFKSTTGLTADIVNMISDMKDEPQWMREFRLKALDRFHSLGDPAWGSELLKGIEFDKIHYFVRATDRDERSWDDVPEYIRKTFDKLGIPEAEKKFLGGVGAQYDSEVVYHNIREDLGKLGVVFLATDQALKEYPELFKEYFGTIVPPGDNRYAALNSAAWSGGSFIYVPKGVKVEVPLQAYFRINSQDMGQFERTLIICDEGSEMHYVEGCTAPVYSSDSLHAAVVEIVVKKGARCRYTTIQNWSNNVYNLVTKRAVAYEDAVMEWVDGNLGSKLTTKFPSIYLMGERAHGEILSLAFAGAGQHQDAGGKVIHAASNTTSSIISKSLSKDGGRTSYRGLLKVYEDCENVKANVRCDALLIDETSRSDTYPTMEIDASDVHIQHEAYVSKLAEDQLFYLMSRGMSEEAAAKMIVNGFVEPIVKELPMEYAVELNRLIELQMDGAIG